MTLKLNGVEIDDLRVNGVKADKGYLNGIKVYERISRGAVIDGDIVVGQLNGYWILVAPSSKWSAGKAWIGNSATSSTLVPGLAEVKTGDDPNSGYTNTANLIAFSGHAYAARHCWEDPDKRYFLPNIQELEFIVSNRGIIGSVDTSSPLRIEDLLENDIWSSTQYHKSSARRAWIDFDGFVHFSGGVGKEGRKGVIPARRLPI